MKKIIIILLLGMLISCRAPLSEISRISADYNLEDVSRYDLQLNCEDARITELKKAFVDQSCVMLHDTISNAIVRHFPDWEAHMGQPDLLLQVSLEQMYGGNEALRLFPSMEAGRSMLTLHLNVFKGNQLIAERRLTGISRIMDIPQGYFTNEDMIRQDSLILADKLMRYLKNPVLFDRQMQQYYEGYDPH